MNGIAQDAGVELGRTSGRVVTRLFRPGDVSPGVSRADQVLGRVMSSSEGEIAEAAQRVRDEFGTRHPAFERTLRQSARLVMGPRAPIESDDMTLVIGATFTAEYAVEGASLCNPSAVAHPDQSGLLAGQLRVVLSVRSIGESHLSSIQFCEAIIGPGRRWTFLGRESPLTVAVVAPGEMPDVALRAPLDLRPADEVSRFVGQLLPMTFHTDILELTLLGTDPTQTHPAAQLDLDALRHAVDNAYHCTFPQDSGISSRVLLPVADQERMGMEDARFVRNLDEDGPAYRGTYTAYSGGRVASRLITTEDFRSFASRRMTGPPSVAKGMALFPRRVDGQLMALTRSDGESISLSRSDDGVDWGPETVVYRPESLWEVVQSGNCGPPMLTDEGWLVLTHGVGLMRAYSIGAIVLDLDDPTQVRAVLDGPLLAARKADREGYVPNVTYTCGAIIHDDTVWIPYGVGDDRVRVASVRLDELFRAMSWPTP